MNRYFKLLGSALFSYYDIANRLRIVKKGDVVTCTNGLEISQFENNKIFSECSPEGVVSYVRGQHPAEKITSRTVYKYNEKNQLTR